MYRILEEKALETQWGNSTEILLTVFQKPFYAGYLKMFRCKLNKEKSRTAGACDIVRSEAYCFVRRNDERYAQRRPVPSQAGRWAFLNSLRKGIDNSAGHNGMRGPAGEVSALKRGIATF